MGTYPVTENLTALVFALNIKTQYWSY